MGNTNSTQVFDPVPVHQSQQPCLHLDSLDHPTKNSEARTEVSMIDQDSYFDDSEDESAVYPLSQQRAAILVPDNNLYHHFAIAPSIEMEDTMTEASPSLSLQSIEENEDHSMILPSAEGMNRRATDEQTDLHWHEPGCDGLRGHSTPSKSSTPQNLSWSTRRQRSTAEDSEGSLGMRERHSLSEASDPGHRYPASSEDTPLSPIRSPPGISGSPPGRKASTPWSALPQQQGSKPYAELHDSDSSSAAAGLGASSSTDWRGRYARFPDPEKDISKPLRYYRKVHKKADAARPRQKLAQHRYWIAVIPQVDHLRAHAASKHFFLKGHRKTTVETVRRIYAVATASDDVQLLLGQVRVGDAECMEDLDICNTKLIVFRCVRSAELVTLVKKHSEGLVLPEASSSLVTDPQPIEIIDD
ncbi:hypothetical protein AMS68_001538 [Peltaster fructicola]|uniref:Uncharacterized protein n=1 Tax=Peltaster fructicola TaxID=286661 RepID=A0A6H0XN00_9PEZI|nr:hypothetical protein AMS68_001538 [Peltaster fructicola]